MRDNDDRPSDLVRSVSRAFRVLEEVGAAAGPLTVKAIARRAQLHLSTTYHLVRTLAYEGYLERRLDGSYVLGGAVAHRFRDLLASFGQAPEVHSVLAHLAATTKRTAYLGRFVAGTIRVTDMVEGPASPYLEDIEVGLDVAAHATAIGKTLLATLPPQRRAEFLADQGMRPFTRRTTTTPEELDAELAGVVPGRPVMEHGQFRDGVSCAGALVRRDSPDDPWWAVVVSTRHEEMPVAVTRQALLAAADLSSAGAADPGW
jgi:DNA-binding IclR family transcriptional regulator